MNEELKKEQEEIIKKALDEEYYSHKAMADAFIEEIANKIYRKEENKFEDYKEEVSLRIIDALKNESFITYHHYAEQHQIWHDYILKEAEYEGKLYELTFNDKALYNHMNKCFASGEVRTQTVHIPQEVVRKNN